MTPHLIEMGAENKASPPEVVVWFPIPTDMNTPESMSPPPANQFVQRIGEDFAHGGTLFQLKPRIVPWHGLKEKVEHTPHPHDICADSMVFSGETTNTTLYHASLNGPRQPPKSCS